MGKSRTTYADGPFRADQIRGGDPVLVEALYDPDASMDATLRNLLDRKGYSSLDAVKQEGRQEAQTEAARKMTAAGVPLEQVAESLSVDTETARRMIS